VERKHGSNPTSPTRDPSSATGAISPGRAEDARVELLAKEVCYKKNESAMMEVDVKE
jgi:hypothetical protein